MYFWKTIFVSANGGYSTRLTTINVYRMYLVELCQKYIKFHHLENTNKQGRGLHLPIQLNFEPFFITI